MSERHITQIKPKMEPEVFLRLLNILFTLDEIHTIIDSVLLMIKSANALLEDEGDVKKMVDEAFNIVGKVMYCLPDAAAEKLRHRMKRDFGIKTDQETELLNEIIKKAKSGGDVH